MFHLMAAHSLLIVGGDTPNRVVVEGARESIPINIAAHFFGARVGRPRTLPDAVRGDKAYPSRAIRAHLRSRGIKARSPEPDDS
jgi:hypothetical protein